ncbi:mitochondrial genome maintenance protein [Gilbertella persicaria]|uniref:mitochondrial genome maintenance protein n=1 Tax=Gilbertella persicaria TaxID=101096 RepID=UPI002220E279|nr:mitochondrial genome maintenance protein [Gilbertella persicaria]KAI8083369.1 mitochondrial genome maintenance protein [Gilbertella persicaria]
MQVFGGLKRTLLINRPYTVLFTRFVATTRYVRVNKKEVVTPASKLKTEIKPTEVKPTEKIESNITTPQQFPTTSQFDTPLEAPEGTGHNWSSSFFGLSTEPFPREVSDILLEPINSDDIEIKPDGLLYLPEIKYRRILNRAFGPGGWGLAPRGEHTISPKNISREYALICKGRFVSQARGEQDFFDISGLPTASEGCKSNALMRCCKDLGIASELWDPSFIRKFKKKHCVEVWAEHVTTKKKKKLWRKKDDVLEYPYKEN